MAKYFDVRDLAVDVVPDETTQKWLVMVCGQLSEVQTCMETKKPTARVVQVRDGSDAELEALREALRKFIEVDKVD